jgi:hypothetical protein
MQLIAGRRRRAQPMGDKFLEWLALLPVIEFAGQDVVGIEPFLEATT